MQWVLIILAAGGVNTSNAPAIHTEIFYAAEACEIAKAKFLAMRMDSITLKAECTPRTMGQYGEMRIDKDPQK